MTYDDHKGPSRSAAIIDIEPAHVDVSVDLDLASIEIIILEDYGGGVSCPLDAARASRLVADLCEGVAVLTGHSTVGRRVEAERLLRNLSRLGLSLHAVARHLRVSSGRVRRWRTGTDVPNLCRLEQLRQLVQRQARND